MPEELKGQLHELADKAETTDDFVSFVMVGPCSRCGNELAKDGMSMDEEDGDPTIGISPECDYQWCTECGQEIKKRE